ncbi:MAG: hypothetical protein KGI51_17155, partial [Rhodospirillales bacterium]|nr:hypothetical protein [Rhodospirillales bacterium]
MRVPTPSLRSLAAILLAALIPLGLGGAMMLHRIVDQRAAREARARRILSLAATEAGAMLAIDRAVLEDTAQLPPARPPPPAAHAGGIVARFALPTPLPPIGRGCPSLPGGGGSGFFLALPGPERRGAVGICVDPDALRGVWWARLRPGEQLRLLLHPLPVDPAARVAAADPPSISLLAAGTAAPGRPSLSLPLAALPVS